MFVVGLLSSHKTGVYDQVMTVLRFEVDLSILSV